MINILFDKSSCIYNFCIWEYIIIVYFWSNNSILMRTILIEFTN